MFRWRRPTHIQSGGKIHACIHWQEISLVEISLLVNHMYFKAYFQYNNYKGN